MCVSAGAAFWGADWAGRLTRASAAVARMMDLRMGDLQPDSTMRLTLRMVNNHLPAQEMPAQKGAQGGGQPDPQRVPDGDERGGFLVAVEAIDKGPGRAREQPGAC